MTVWGEFHVNSTTRNDQIDSDNASSANGMSVAAWVDTYSSADRDIRAQLYSASGAPLGPEISVDYSGTDESDPAVAMDAQGNFVVTWTRRYSDGNSDILARRYNSSGVPITGAFNVATDSRREYASDVAMAADGRIAVSYTLDYSAADQDIYVQRFDHAGGYLGAFAVASTGKGEWASSIAMAPDGRFDVAYEFEYSGYDHDVWVNQYSATGSLLTSQGIAVSTVYEGRPSISMNDFGDAVVAYEGMVNGIQDIKARWVHSWGAIGNEIRVTSTNSMELDPSVALSRNDNLFVVAYEVPGSSSPNQSNGERRCYVTEVYGTSVYSTTDLGGRIREPSISIGGDGYYFVTYSTWGAYSDGHDIKGRRGHM